MAFEKTRCYSFFCVYCWAFVCRYHVYLIEYCRLRAWNPTPCIATSSLKRLAFVSFLVAGLDRRKERIISGWYCHLHFFSCRLQTNVLFFKIYVFQKWLLWYIVLLETSTVLDTFAFIILWTAVSLIHFLARYLSIWLNQG